MSSNVTYTVDEHGMATATIPKSTYDRLKDREDKLECLEAAGVDNWSGWDYAMELYHEGEEND